MNSNINTEENKTKCELCSMDATHRDTDKDGLIHFYCEHHAPKSSIRIGEGPSMFKTYAPLIKVFIVIILATILTNRVFGFAQGRAMEVFMGYFFLCFGLLKAIAWKDFPNSFRGYDPLAKISSVYAWVYPGIELVLAFLFLYGVYTHVASWITIFILSITSIGVIRSIQKGETLQCVCLGSLLSLPLSAVTVAENILMIVMAIIIVI